MLIRKQDCFSFKRHKESPSTSIFNVYSQAQLFTKVFLLYTMAKRFANLLIFILQKHLTDWQIFW